MEGDRPGNTGVSAPCSEQSGLCLCMVQRHSSVYAQLGEGVSAVVSFRAGVKHQAGHTHLVKPLWPELGQKPDYVCV